MIWYDMVLEFNIRAFKSQPHDAQKRVRFLICVSKLNLIVVYLCYIWHQF